MKVAALISIFPLDWSNHSVIYFSSLRLLRWYQWHCPLSYKHQSPSSAWNSGHMEVPTGMYGPWISCSCSLCCLARTHMLLSSPSTWAVALTSLPTGVTHFKTRLGSAFMWKYGHFLAKITEMGCNKGSPHPKWDTLDSLSYFGVKNGKWCV